MTSGQSNHEEGGQPAETLKEKLDRLQKLLGELAILEKDLNEKRWEVKQAKLEIPFDGDPFVVHLTYPDKSADAYITIDDDFVPPDKPETFVATEITEDFKDGKSDFFNRESRRVLSVRGGYNFTLTLLEEATQDQELN